MYPALFASLVVLTWLLGLACAGVSLFGILAITRRRFVRGRGLRAVVLSGTEAVKAGAVLIPGGIVLATPFLAFGVWGVIDLLRGGL
jgi:hypothetical protein